MANRVTRPIWAAAVILAGCVGAASANEYQVAYSLAPGTISNPINVPAVNTPITVTCAQNNGAFRGIGQMTLLRVGPPLFLEWVGIDTATNQGATSVVTHGFSGLGGIHMIYCDAASSVDIQVQSPTTIQVTNVNAAAASGVINFVW